MLVTFARYAGVNVSVTARGDLRHHVIEDVAIALGAALRKYLPTRITRFGDRTIPMDDALVHVSLDLGGRPYYSGALPSTMYDHWMRSFAEHAGATLHVRVLAGVIVITWLKLRLKRLASPCVMRSSRRMRFSVPRAT